MSIANKNFRRHGQKGGWYRIAWAFLKLVDDGWKSGRFGERTRLQLYRPSLKVTDGEGNIKDLWAWWRTEGAPEEVLAGAGGRLERTDAGENGPASSIAGEERRRWQARPEARAPR